MKPAPPGRVDEQVRLLYEDVTKNVADGSENDGRRVLTGKSGSRQAAFLYLVRELGVPIEAALVKNRLAAPPLGTLSEVESYDGLLLRIRTGNQDPSSPEGVRWLTVRDKFAPAWYVPAEYRGQPAFRLIPGTPHETTPVAGANDGVAFAGRAALHDDGSASVQLSQRFDGKAGIGMRNVLDKVPGAQLHDFIESALVGRNLPGARVKDFSVEHKDDPSVPLIVHVEAEIPSSRGAPRRHSRFADLPDEPHRGSATLPSRQTPLLLQLAFHVEVHFEIVVPDAVRMPANLSPAEARDGERSVKVKDAVHANALVLDRVVDIPAGRVQPGREYERFLHFIREGDNLVRRELVLGR